jgi:hypothetical protein
MSDAELKSVESQLHSILPVDVVTPSIPVSVFCYQGELMLAALENDRAVLEAAGLAPTVIDALPQRLGALATAEASWQVFRLQGRPDAQNALEDSGYKLREETYSVVEWGLRDHPGALAPLPRIREGTGLADLCADLEALATLVRANAATFAIPGFDANAWANLCEAKAGELRKGAAGWKLDRTQAELLDRRNRAFTLAAQTVSRVRAAAQYAFRNEADGRRLSPYRDQYTIDRQRRSRSRTATQPSPQPPSPQMPGPVTPA